MRRIIGIYEKGLFITFVAGLVLLIVGSIFMGIGQKFLLSSCYDWQELFLSLLKD